MNKLDTVIDGALYALYMFFSCLVCMLVEWFISRVLTLLLEISPFTLSLIRVIIYTVGVNAILSIAAYKEGHRSARASAVGTLISGIFATAVHFLFCLLFTFEPFCAGGVKYISAMLKFGRAMTLNNISNGLSRTDSISIFFINALISVGFIMLFKVMGAKKRVAERSELDLPTQ